MTCHRPRPMKTHPKDRVLAALNEGPAVSGVIASRAKMSKEAARDWLLQMFKAGEVERDKRDRAADGRRRGPVEYVYRRVERHDPV